MTKEKDEVDSILCKNFKNKWMFILQIKYN